MEVVGVGLRDSVVDVALGKTALPWLLPLLPLLLFLLLLFLLAANGNSTVSVYPPLMLDSMEASRRVRSP